MLVSKTFRELVRQAGQGRITDAHVRAFLDDPDRVLGDKAPTQRQLIALLPPGTDYSSLVSDGQTVAYLYGQADSIRVGCGRDQWGLYNHAHSLSLAGGKPLFVTQSGDLGGPERVVWGDRSYPIHPHVKSPQVLPDGRMMYCALIERPGEHEMWFVMKCEKRATVLEHDRIWDLRHLEDRPLFCARWDGDRIWWGDEPLTKREPYADVSLGAVGEPCFVYGKLAYIWRKNGRACIIHDGKQVTPTFPDIRELNHSNDHRFFCAQEDGKEFIFYNWRKSAHFSRVWQPTMVGVLPLFCALVQVEGPPQHCLIYGNRETPVMMAPQIIHYDVLGDTGRVAIVFRKNRRVFRQEFALEV